MAKLWAFGCSMTYGTALPDCKKIHPSGHITHGHYPSQYAWPARLAKSLNLDCINKSIPGSSNKVIWHQVIRHMDTFEKNDKIFILWSYKDRHAIIHDKKNVDKMYTHIGPWQHDKKSRYYYKHLHYDFDVNADLNLRQSHIDLVLKAKGIEGYQLLVRREKWKGYETYHKEQWNQAFILETEFDTIRGEFAKAEDGLHPDEHAHTYFAQMIEREINTLE